MTGTFFSNSIADTRKIAAQFASHLSKGDVVQLLGDLGAGKTAFAQCIASALGVTRPVTSPTFCIVSEYPTSSNLTLVHMDLYRLSNEDDVLAIGWEDYLSSGAILLVEWPDRAGSLIPPAAWTVHLSATGEDSRTIRICHATSS